MSELKPWETPEWRAKIADPIGDIVHYYAPAIGDEQADALVLFIVNLISGFASAKLGEK